MDWTGAIVQTVIVILYSFFYGGPLNWNIVRRVAFLVWAASEYMALVYLIGNGWRTVFWGIGLAALFIFIFFSDDSWNKRKRQFSSIKLRVQTYLAYGVEAKRPLPA